MAWTDEVNSIYGTDTAAKHAKPKATARPKPNPKTNAWQAELAQQYSAQAPAPPAKPTRPARPVVKPKAGLTAQQQASTLAYLENMKQGGHTPLAAPPPLIPPTAPTVRLPLPPVKVTQTTVTPVGKPQQGKTTTSVTPAPLPKGFARLPNGQIVKNPSSPAKEALIRTGFSLLGPLGQLINAGRQAVGEVNRPYEEVPSLSSQPNAPATSLLPDQTTWVDVAKAGGLPGLLKNWRVAIAQEPGATPNTTLGAGVNAVRRGASRMLAPGVTPADPKEEILYQQRVDAANPPTKAYQRQQQQPTLAGALAPENLAQAVPEMLTSFAPAELVGRMAGPLQPLVMAGYLAGQMGHQEYIGYISQQAAAVQQQHPEMSQEQALDAVLAQPDVQQEAKRRGWDRGLIMGSVSALTGGIGGKVARFIAPEGANMARQIAAPLADAGMQMAGFTAGEAGTQLANEGKITDPQAIYQTPLSLAPILLPGLVGKLAGVRAPARPTIAETAPGRGNVPLAEETRATGQAVPVLPPPDVHGAARGMARGVDPATTVERSTPPTVAENSPVQPQRVRLRNGVEGTVTRETDKLYFVRGDDGKSYRPTKGLVEIIEAPKPPAVKANADRQAGWVGEMPTNDILADPERFQYKRGVGSQTGAGAELKEVTAYDPEKGGVLLVWRDPVDSNTYVVNGHHRLELAKRAGQDNVLVRYLDAPDAATARYKGALVNIAEGRGTAIDAATLLRETGTTAEDLQSAGVSMRGKIAQDGAALANLQPSLFGRISREEMPVSRGVVIGQMLPDHAQQLDLVRMLDKAEASGKKITDPVLSELIRQVKGAETVTATTSSLFGEETFAQSNAFERAELASYVREKLSKDQRLFGYVAKGERAKELARGGNVIDVEQSGQIANEASRALGVFDQLAHSGGKSDISDALNAAARDLVNTPRSQHNGIKERLYTQIQQAVSDVLNGTETGGTAGRGVSAESRGVQARDADLFGETTGRQPELVTKEKITPKPTLADRFTPEEKAVKPVRGASGGAGSPVTELPAKPIGGKAAVGVARIEPAPLPGGKPKKFNQMMRDFSANLGKKIAVGKTPRGFAGFYRFADSLTIIRGATNLGTAAHEVAHLLDSVYGVMKPWSGPRVRSPYDAELGKFSQFGSVTKSGPRSTLQYQRAEGLAEFVRAYIINPGAAKAAAPSFYQHFVKSIPPEKLAVLNSFSRDVREWAGLPANQRAWASFMEGDGAAPLRDRIISGLRGDGYAFQTTWIDKLQGAAQDALAPVFKAITKAEDMRGLRATRPGEISAQSPSADPRVLMRSLAGLGKKVENIFENGMITAKNTRATKGGVSWLLEPLDTSSTEALLTDMRDTISLMLAQRSMEKRAQSGKATAVGLGGGLYSESSEASAIVRELSADPARYAKLEEAASRYREWADANLRYLLDKGRISQDAYDAIKANNEQYVALQVFFEEGELPHTGRGVGSKLGAVRNPLQKFKGSQRMRENPYVNLLAQTHRMIGEADRNESMQMFRKLLVNQRGMYDQPAPDLASIGYRGKTGDKNSIKIFVNGKPEVWVFEPGVYEALKGLQDMPAITNEIAKAADWILKGQANLLRAGVTYSPPFIIRNVPRDVAHRQQVSDIPGLSLSLPKLRSTPEQVTGYELAGAGHSGWYLSSSADYYKVLKNTVRELTKAEGPIKRTLLYLPRKYAKLAEGSETVGRMSEYAKAYKYGTEKLGYGDLDAQYYAASKARGILDYGIAGSWGRWVNRYVPFTNPAVQGIARNLSSMRSNPRQYAIRWALFALAPTLLTYAWNARNKKDLEEYRQLPAQQRGMFYNLKMSDNNWMRIPKNYEVGVMTTGLEHAIDYAHGNKNAFDGWGGVIANATLPMDASTLSGPFSTEVQLMTNYDFFREKTIVPPYEQMIPIDERNGTQYASRLSKSLHEIPGLQGFDPRQIDFWIQDRTGSSGNMAINLSNIGRPDRQLTLADKLNLATGLFAKSPAYNAVDVQSVLRDLQEFNGQRGRAIYGMGNPVKDMNELLDQYFAAKTDAERDRLARQVRQSAGELREQMANYREAVIEARAEDKSSRASRLRGLPSAPSLPRLPQR